MKKHLVAFLSMIGLAGAAAPAQGQVLKGADAKSDIKAESKIKYDKQKAEQKNANAQLQDNRKDKWAKANVQEKDAKVNLQQKEAKANLQEKDAKLNLQHKEAKNESSIKGEKASAEVKANKSQATIKLTNANSKAQTTQQK